jgi:hypothetical protein
MNEVLYQFPAYVEEIVNRLYNRDWFIHPFDLQAVCEIYNPAGYLYSSEFKGIEYTIFLDLNIYQYVLSAYKKKNKNELHRDAVALMVFGKVTNAHFDPTLAVYEKLNYEEQCSEELLDDLVLFRRIDNSEIDGLAKFALGLDDHVPLGATQLVDKGELKFELTKYRRLKKWDSFYAFILKISELHSLDKLSNDEKMASFLKWCFSDFMYSLAATSFVIMLWGRNGLPKLMKYKEGLAKNRRGDALLNMTWDLFLLDKFFESWVNKKTKQEFIFVSNDIPLKKVLELAISIQKTGSFDHLTDQLSPTLIEELNKISDMMACDEGRRISKTTDLKAFRDGIIKYHEKKLLF